MKTYGGAGHDVSQRNFICIGEMCKDIIYADNNLKERCCELLECRGIFTCM